MGAFVFSYRQPIGGAGEAGIIVSMLAGDRIYLHSWRMVFLWLFDESKMQRHQWLREKYGRWKSMSTSSVSDNIILMNIFERSTENET